MSKKNLITTTATVIASSGHGLYRVRITENHEAQAHLSDKMGSVLRKRILEPGAEITVELSPYDLTQARIIKEKKEK